MSDAPQQTPSISLDPHLVTFVDILGFGDEVKAAKTSEALVHIHDKVRRIQAAFQMPSASIRPATQRETNLHYGKRVVALSDSIIVANNFECEAKHTTGTADLVGWAVYELIQSQYQCVLFEDFFLRGGISVGPFYFENDVLLSSPVVEGHELESKRAIAPLIVLTLSTVRWIMDTAGPDSIIGKREREFFRPLVDHQSGLNLFALDYLGIAMTDDDPHNILRIHKEKLIAAFTAAPDERVKDKYRTLIEYHNDTIESTSELLRPHIIDLRNYSSSAK